MRVMIATMIDRANSSLVHIPPGIVQGARGRMRVLVVGVPDIAEDDYFEAAEHKLSGAEKEAPSAS